MVTMLFFLSQSQLVGGPVDQLVDQLIGWSVAQSVNWWVISQSDVPLIDRLVSQSVS